MVKRIRSFKARGNNRKMKHENKEGVRGVLAAVIYLTTGVFANTFLQKWTDSGMVEIPQFLLYAILFASLGLWIYVIRNKRRFLNSQYWIYLALLGSISTITIGQFTKIALFSN